MSGGGKRSLRESAFAWALLSPTLLVLGVFVFFPGLESIVLSLNDVDSFTMRKTFVGLANYRMLGLSPQYWQSVQVTIAFTVLTVIPSVVLSLAVALGLDARPYFRGIIRTVFLMPVAISSAMAAMLWVFFYNPSSGYLNYILESWFGVRGPNWLGDGNWAIVAVALVTFWKELGFNIIFFLAGIASIPGDYREAALVDGAGPWQRLWHVTLPCLSPTILFVSVVTMIQSFQVFGQIHILTAGGPAGATSTLVYNLYRDGFQNFQTGSASAQAVILFLIMLGFTLIQFSVARRSK